MINKKIAPQEHGQVSPSSFPADWPGEGPIDLSIHDLPHASSTMEWWYINSHFKTRDGSNYSIFASFFRKVVDYDKKTKSPIYAHSLIWALYDEKNKSYHPFSLVDKLAPKLGKKKLKKGEIVNDERLRRASLEVVNKGKIPLPDRLFKGDATVSLKSLSLNFDGNTFTKRKDGCYVLRLREEKPAIDCTIIFKPKKPVTRHGDNGVGKGVSGEDMFYYFIPRCEVSGTLELKHEKARPIKGIGWYDHEFGRHLEKKEAGEKSVIQKDLAWIWLSLQLDNGCEISTYDLFKNETQLENIGHGLIFIDPEGMRHPIEDFTLESQNKWTSTKTFNQYPTRWILKVPQLKLKLNIEAAIQEQEFMTFISHPAFWEGRVNATGKIGSEDISGPGFIERSGFDKVSSLDDFFKDVSRETLKSVAKILPYNPDKEKATLLISGKGNEHLLKSPDVERYSDFVIKPIREIVDRGGKAWRSYAALACCDVVGGDSQKLIDWLALPELMHTGSLIVDDVEDQSEVRRGGPTCHKVYGDAIAINAGSTCYFLAQMCIYESDFEDWKKLKIYDYYFQGLRTAHAGQALDISGLHYLVPEIVESGNGKLLEQRVLAIHRLKLAVPVSFLARIGAVLGNGTDEQVEGLGQFFEAIGLAFQIIDDTLNLKGFRDDLKSKGEDITHGKITYPVAKAMKILPTKKERQQLWDIVRSRPKDPKTIGEAVKIIDDCGALNIAEKEAKYLVERAWKKLDPLVEDSLVKIKLRAFSWYVLDRQY